MLGPDVILKREHSVAHELKDVEQVAVFDESNSELVVLNQIGGVIWEMIDGRTSLAQIASEIAANVQNAPSQESVQAEVLSFAETLLGRRAVSIVE